MDGERHEPGGPCARGLQPPQDDLRVVRRELPAGRVERQPLRLEQQSALSSCASRASARPASESPASSWPPGEQRERRPPHRRVEGERGQAEPSASRSCSAIASTQRLAVAELEQVGDAPVDALQLGLAVVGRARRRDQLVGDREALLGVGRAPERDVPRAQGLEQRRPPARRPAASASALSALAQLDGRLVVELDRQAREQPRSQRRVVGDGGERLLEQRPGPPAGRADAHARSRRPERGACEGAASPSVPRRRRGVRGTRSARRRPVARAQPRVAEREQQLQRAADRARRGRRRARARGASAASS